VTTLEFIGLLVLIFVLKLINTTMSTVRIRLVNRGFSKIGSVITFFEIALWVVISVLVLTDIKSTPLKAVAYALGYSFGIIIGLNLEKKIGLGQIEIHLICEKEESDQLTTFLQENKYAYTKVKGEGAQGAKTILLLYLNRKNSNLLKDKIKQEFPDVLMSAKETEVSGGTIKKNNAVK
jgi:uncharacterized protein YebE (UPF0316 family)